MSPTVHRIGWSFFAVLCLGSVIGVLIESGLSTSFLLGCIVGVVVGIVGCFDFRADVDKAMSMPITAAVSGQKIALSILIGVSIPGIARILGMQYNIAIFIIISIGVAGAILFTWIGWFFKSPYHRNLTFPNIVSGTFISNENLDWRKAKECLQREEAEWLEQQRRR